MGDDGHYEEYPPFEFNKNIKKINILKNFGF